MKLLTMGKASPKLVKSDKADLGFLSAIQYLAPHKLSGRNVCPQASPGCIAACLNTAGRGRKNSVQQARVNRTNFMFEDRKGYKEQLRTEVIAFNKKAKRLGKVAAVRLNGTSDLKWEELYPELIEEFADVQFYDYTKITKRMLRYCDGELPVNYHLTYSRSEVNHEQCLKVLEAGGNVAVVFRDKELPEQYEGFTVFNADDTDLRFLDPAGTISGLYAKGKAKNDDSGFVVDAGVK